MVRHAHVLQSAHDPSMISLQDGLQERGIRLGGGRTLLGGFFLYSYFVLVQSCSVALMKTTLAADLLPRHPMAAN
jgi:hypothetical protein